MIKTSIYKSFAKRQVIKAALMIAGTAIGAGMLGIPLVTAEVGLKGAFSTTVSVWLYMLITGLFLMEVSVSMKEKGGFLNLAEKYLPKYGKAVTAALFLFLYGILLVAYISAGTKILNLCLYDSFVVTCLFPIALGCILSLKTSRVFSIISALTIPMWVYFFLFYWVGAEFIQVDRFSHGSVSKGYLAIPVLFGAFGYHNVIPSVAKYLHFDKKNLQAAICLGSLIPCVIYLLWQVLILGMVDQDTLALARSQGVPVVALLSDVSGSKYFGNIGAIFAFFAIVTSALGVGISVVDFIDRGKRIKTIFCVILIPTIIALVNPGIFLRALSFAGGFGESILNGIIPIWMYMTFRKKEQSMTKNLKIFTFFLLLIAAFVVVIEIRNIL